MGLLADQPPSERVPCGTRGPGSEALKLHNSVQDVKRQGHCIVMAIRVHPQHGWEGRGLGVRTSLAKLMVALGESACSAASRAARAFSADPGARGLSVSSPAPATALATVSTQSSCWRQSLLLWSLCFVRGSLARPC